MLQLLPPDAQLWTPYGATECLPVAVIEGRELLTLRARTETGAGTCVGRPVAANEVRIIGITDEAVDDWRDAVPVKAGITPGSMISTSEPSPSALTTMLQGSRVATRGSACRA